MNRPQDHVPVLDGIRGLAILLVLIAHFNGEAILKEYFPLTGPIITKLALTGLMGVDLFFVLSGFLITGILLDTKGSKRFFLNFYARRVLRIFPLYFGTLALIFLVLPALVDLDPAGYEIVDKQWWLWAYLSNFPGHPAWDESKLFALGHFWSLAVEEHFYLMWPFVVFSLSARQLKNVCLSWVAISIAAGLASSVTDGEVSRYLRWSTLCLSGSLTLGAYCALVAREKSGLATLASSARKMIIPVGCLLLLLGMLPRRIHSDLVILSMHYVSWVFFASLLIYVLTSNEESRLYRVLCSRIMILFGKLSYGLYIFHGILRPTFETYYDRGFLIDTVGSPLLGILIYFGLAIGSSFVMAWLSWQLYERHFLKLKRFFHATRKATHPSTTAVTIGGIE